MTSAPKPRPSDDAPDAMTHAHSLELERAVLAVLLDGRHAEAYTILAEACPELDAWYHRDHRIVALAIHEVVAKGEVGRRDERVSAEMVAGHLARMPFTEAMWKITPPDERRDKEMPPRARLAEGEHEESALAAIGGFNGLSDLATVTGIAANFRANCEQLTKYLRLRRAIKTVLDARRRLTSADGSNQLQAITSDTLNALSGAMGRGRQVGGVAAGAAEALARHDQAALLRTEGKQARVASWGVPDLDEACPLAPGRLILLAAKPGGGKTSLLLQVAQATRAMHSGDAVRLVSWEIPQADLASILVAREVELSRKAIERGWLRPEQRERYVAAMERWKGNDVPCLFSGPSTNLGDIVAWIRLQHRLAAGRLLIVGVDYAQKIPGPKPGMREYDRVTEISSALMDLKNQLGICILALAQYSREEKGPGTKAREPRASDLRGSGALEQDADAVVHLYPENVGEDTVGMRIIIDKNRGYATYVGERAIRADFHKTHGQVFKPPLPEGAPLDEPAHSSGRSRHDRVTNQHPDDKPPF